MLREGGWQPRSKARQAESLILQADKERAEGSARPSWMMAGNSQSCLLPQLLGTVSLSVGLLSLVKQAHTSLWR